MQRLSFVFFLFAVLFVFGTVTAYSEENSKESPPVETQKPIGPKSKEKETKESRKTSPSPKKAKTAGKESKASAKKENPPPFKLPFQLYGSTSLSYDETVIPRSDSRETADILIKRFRVGGNYSRRMGNSYLRLNYNLTTKSYQDLEERDSVDHRASLYWSQKINDKLSWNFSNYYAYLQDTGGEADETISSILTYRQNIARFSTLYKFTRKLELQLDVRNLVRNYEEPGRNDYRTTTPAWQIGWKPGKKVKWTFRHEYEMIHVETQEVVEYNTFLVGFSMPIPLEMHLQASVGTLFGRHFRTLDPTVRIDLTRKMGKLSLRTRWNRSIAVSTNRSELTRRDTFSFNPQYRLTPETRLSGNLSYIMSKSLDNGRTNTQTLRTGVELRRELTKWLSMELKYTYVDQQARGTSGQTLSGSIVTVGLNAKY